MSVRRKSSGDISDLEHLKAEKMALEQLLESLESSTRDQAVKLEDLLANLRESESRARAVIENALDSVIIIDSKGIILEFNPAAERTFGYAREEAMGKAIGELIVPEELRDRHESGLRRARFGGPSKVLDQRLEFPAIRSDGSTLQVELLISRVELRTGPIFVGYLRDITEQKENEWRSAQDIERTQTLDRASALLNGTLNPEMVLKTFAEIAVVSLADWCAIDVMRGKDLEQLVVCYKEADEGEVVTNLSPTEEAAASSVIGALAVVHSGSPLLVESITDALLEQIAPDTESFSRMKALGLRSAMIIPLRSMGQVFGAITLVSTDKRRHYNQRDLLFAQDLAGRASAATENARLFAERAEVANTLQQSLLPPRLPAIPPLELASRYVPGFEGSKVGGDFYDVFQTAPGDWAMVMGDVMGKGAPAATITALVRHTIRATAMQARKPSRVLQRLNEALIQQLSGEDFVTVTYSRLRSTPKGWRLSVCCGGHPLPRLVNANGEVSRIGRPGTLIGQFEQIELKDHVTKLLPGDSVVLFTDGVVEARSPSEELGDEGVDRLLAELGSSSADAIAEGLLDGALRIQHGTPHDDIAVLVLRVPLID